MQSNNKPQASKTFGWVEDFLNTYTLYPSGVPGNTFFVDSGHTNASDYNDGLSKDTPREQIESCFTAATALVTANNGDIIYVMPGHEETVDAAGDLDLDVAGVTIIFLGEGEAQAKITLGTTSTADVDIDAANITLVNPKFVAEVDALAGAIDVNAADFRIVNGQYRDGTTIDTTDCIVATSNATRLKIHGWRYLPGNQAGTEKESNIQLNGVDNAELFDIYIAGAFNAACIENVTDEILNVHMKDIVLNNTDADPSPGMVLDSNCDGIAERVLIRIASGTTYVSDISDINWYESYGAYGDGNTLDDPIGTAAGASLEAKLNVPVADTSDNAFMRDVVGNKTDTSAAVSDSASLVAYSKTLLNQHDVAVADATTNTAMSDVVGNKTDTSAAVSDSASLVAYAKTLVNQHDVPVADTSDNAAVSDVVGNKTDTSAAVSDSASLVAYSKTLINQHDVPVADTSDNAALSDVVGNKTDTSAAVSDSASLVAYAKTLVNQHDVPVADTSDNAALSDVVGNKTDTSAAVSDSASLVAYAKTLVNQHDVPVADTSDNAALSDVVGNKTDTSAAVSDSASLVAYAKTLVNQHDVPVADTSDNAALSDVVGNKTDTSAAVSDSASLVAYAKMLINQHDVPVADTSDNAAMSDVIGNKTDTSSGITDSASLIAYSKQLLNQHAVPVADTSDSARMADSVGNKDDAAVVGAVTTSASLMAFAKQLVTTGDALHNDGANYFVNSVSFSSATWNTQAAHEIAVVTGVVRMRIVPDVGTTLVGNNTTIELGTETSASLFHGVTSATSLGAGEIWQSATSAGNISSLATGSILDQIISGDDVGYTVAAQNVSSGVINFHVWWEPLSATGAVTAGAGGTFA